MSRSSHPHDATPTSEHGIFLWLCWHAMKKLQLDTTRIFASVNLPDQAPDKSKRRPNQYQQPFWRVAEQVSNDPLIGLHTGANMAPFRGHVIEYLFLSSPTFGAGLSRFLRYHSLASDTFPLQLTTVNQEARLLGFSHPVRHFLECALTVALNFLKLITNQPALTCTIWLEHTPPGGTSEHQAIWQCPVKTGQPATGIIFDASLLQLPSPAAQPELLRVHESLAQEQLAAQQQNKRSWQIERELGNLLESGELTPATLAERLGTTAQQLRHELASLDTGFNELTQHYRRHLAKRLLAQTSESLDHIVYLTGFSEASAFSRAFKRWTGETPSAYRQRKQTPGI